MTTGANQLSYGTLPNHVCGDLVDFLRVEKETESWKWNLSLFLFSKCVSLLHHCEGTSCSPGHGCPDVNLCSLISYPLLIFPILSMNAAAIILKLRPILESPVKDFQCGWVNHGLVFSYLFLFFDVHIQIFVDKPSCKQNSDVFDLVGWKKFAWDIAIFSPMHFNCTHV